MNMLKSSLFQYRGESITTYFLTKIEQAVLFMCVFFLVYL